MDRWLPPRTPGGNPPPRFAATPPPPEAPAPEAGPAAGPGDEPGTRMAPAGWAPPTAHRDPPAAVAAPPTARRDPPPTAFAPPSPARDGDRAATTTAERTTTDPPRLGGARPDRPRLGGARRDGLGLGGAPAGGPARRPPGQAATRPNVAAVWALVLGIVGVVLLFLSIGTLFVLTLPCSAAAWVLARRAIRQIDRGETVHGAGQAQVALWLGRIGVVVGLGAMVAFIVLTLAGFDFDHLRDNLQRDLERRRDAAR